MRSCNLLTIAITFMLLIFCAGMNGQVVPEPVINDGIYTFLDELAADGIIDLNSAIKPYNRKIIGELLDQASVRAGDLNNRQQKELAFYRSDFCNKTADGRMRLVYNPATAQYHDSVFSVTVSPLFGLDYGSDNAITWKNGAKVFGSYGNWGFFAALQDNHQDPFFGRPEYLTRERGGHIKNHTDFSEMTAGISYAWKWADLSFIKDAPVWGSGYAGTNILSGRAPSFMQIRLHIKPVKWGEMTWFHGWLNSMVVDSARSFWVNNAYGTDYREVYHQKFIAANLITLSPYRHLHISAGNSVIYSDPRLTPYYLMPFFFYKSVDHGVNSGIDNSNSQMFIDISSYNIRKLHLYGTLFVDELSTSRFTTPDYNFFSWKGGFRTGNFSFLPNLWLAAECTFTYPLTFQHYVPVLTFENQGYNLGNYLRDNSRSYWMALDYKPVRGMNVRIWHEKAERGPDYQSLGGPRVGMPYMTPVEWRSITTGAEVQYLITGGVMATVTMIHSSVQGAEGWIAPQMYGTHTTFNGGIVWGF